MTIAMLLYSSNEGRPGMQGGLSDDQWIEC